MTNERENFLVFIKKKKKISSQSEHKIVSWDLSMSMPIFHSFKIGAHTTWSYKNRQYILNCSFLDVEPGRKPVMTCYSENDPSDHRFYSWCQFFVADHRNSRPQKASNIKIDFFYRVTLNLPQLIVENIIKRKFRVITEIGSTFFGCWSVTGQLKK
jgi:hypothetical protein